MSTVEALEAIGRRATSELRQARRDYRGRTEARAGPPERASDELCGDLLGRVMAPAQLSSPASPRVGRRSAPMS